MWSTREPDGSSSRPPALLVGAALVGAFQAGMLGLAGLCGIAAGLMHQGTGGDSVAAAGVLAVPIAAFLAASFSAALRGSGPGRLISVVLEIVVTGVGGAALLRLFAAAPGPLSAALTIAAFGLGALALALLVAAPPVTRPSDPLDRA